MVSIFTKLISNFQISVSQIMVNIYTKLIHFQISISQIMVIIYTKLRDLPISVVPIDVHLMRPYSSHRPNPPGDYAAVEEFAKVLPIRLKFIYLLVNLLFGVMEPFHLNSVV
jgi:hypothetical protein